MVELGVRAIIKDNEGNVLLVKSARGLKRGTWSLPGGKVNFKETPADAIKREIKEELNLEFDSVFITYREDVALSPSLDYLTLFFSGNVTGKISVKPDEIQDYKYFSLDKIKNGTEEISLGHKEVLLTQIYMELRQSREWEKYLESLGWQTEVIDGCALRIKKLGILGCIIKIQRPGLLPLQKIDTFAKKNHALFVKIEPLDNSQISNLKSQMYKLDTWPLTPARTIFLDLTKSGEELLKSFSKDTRQSIKKAYSDGASEPGISYQIVNLPSLHNYHTTVRGNSDNDVTIDNYLESFYKIWKQTGVRGGFWVPPFNEYASEVYSFSGKGFFILSYLEGKHLVSGCLILICDGIAYYHHAASTVEGQNLHSTYGQMWQAILEAKKRGCQKLDLEGIFDPRFKEMFKKWLNFSAFKLKWGGEVYEYPGSFTKTYNPLVGLLFRFGN